ncbi:MAG: 6-phosphogluconolactonase [Chloroflexales bacterium]|nr:6-phosphogluconolactonase [Chloroflexales bacterium]
MAAIDVFPDKPALLQAAAERFVTLASEAIAGRGRFTAALAGGGTPKPLYELLASEPYAAQVDWRRVHIGWGDERCVPPDDERSNYRMTRLALLDKVPIPPANIHRIKGELTPHKAADDYERELRELFGDAAPFGAFDLMLLGLGDNGHTASLFPGTAALREERRWVVPQYVEVVTMWRVTLTAPLISAAANVLFLAEGAAKAGVLRRVIEGPHDPDVLPAQLIQPQAGALRWMLDAAAAAELDKLTR